MPSLPSPPPPPWPSLHDHDHDYHQHQPPPSPVLAHFAPGRLPPSLDLLRRRAGRVWAFFIFFRDRRISRCNNAIARLLLAL